MMTRATEFPVLPALPKLKAYYWLTKPGIIYGNVLTGLAGFLFASHWHIDFGLLLATIFGMSLVIASACVYNNYIDREIDTKMSRTKARAIASKQISGRAAVVFATVLGAAGFVVLTLWVNWLTVAVGVVGFVDYIVFYGWSKRNSIHGTLVGSVSGAMPLLAGYTAVSDRLDLGALLLFLIMACWQMPHFYAIAIYRLDDYRAAGLPVWPVKKGIASTKRQIISYMLVFLASVVLVALFEHAGYVYLVVMVMLGAAWLRLGLQGFGVPDDTAWARRVFKFSLIVLLGLSGMLSLSPLLP